MAERMQAEQTTARPPEAALELALDRAAATCLRHGAQLTELRRQVLRLVLQSAQPIGAYALLDQLRGARRGAAPPTVYRALDFLLAQGLIHKVERLNAFIGCDETGHGHAHGSDHPHQFLICGQCGSTAEICDSATIAAIAAAAGRSGFVPHRTTIEVEGLCARCAEAAAPARAEAS
ncbi:Fur family transcriptional regulator [Falsiroseomonas sp.]|uniref:Fur family transcriptional regulator n=1 Tax=Falsiroseomonas sp. TaxID=2870721 RepID=UPI003F7100DC